MQMVVQAVQEAVLLQPMELLIQEALELLVKVMLVVIQYQHPHLLQAVVVEHLL
jgi:hypothetical protein